MWHLVSDVVRRAKEKVSCRAALSWGAANFSREILTVINVTSKIKPYRYNRRISCTYRCPGLQVSRSEGGDFRPSTRLVRKKQLFYITRLSLCRAAYSGNAKFLNTSLGTARERSSKTDRTLVHPRIFAIRGCRALSVQCRRRTVGLRKTRRCVGRI